MLNHKAHRKPISRWQQLIAGALLIIAAVPVVSIAGFSVPVVLDNVTTRECNAVVVALEEFYSELTNGSDYQSIRERFLTSDYFDDPTLTLENLDEAVRRPLFDNTLSLIREIGVGPAKEVHCRVMSVQRDGDEFVVTQQLDVIAERISGDIEYRDEYGAIERIARRASTGDPVVEDCHLVKALIQRIRLRLEDGAWRISKFDDGMAVMRMDTDNPYGPIFLVWMEDIDSQTTPYGAGVFKVFPRDLIPDARNTTFLLER